MERNCNHCGKLYEAKKSTSQYCSSSCRGVASVKRKVLKDLGDVPGGSVSEDETPAASRTAIAMPPNVDAASQFIINLQAKEIDRFESLYNEERKSKKDLKKLNGELKDKIAQIEVDQKIADATRSEKGQLEGFVNSTFMQGLMPFIGPAIQEMSTSMAKRMSAPAPAAPGVAGLADSPIGQFMSWLSGQPEDVQKYVWELLQAFMQVNGSAELLQKLVQTRDFIMGDYMRRTG